MSLRIPLAALALTLAAAASAGAQLNGSTVSIAAQNGLPTPPCKEAAVTRTVGAGAELLFADWTGPCVGFYTANVSDAGLSLGAAEWGNYTLGTLRLSFLGAPSITNVMFLGYTGEFLDPNYPRNQSNLTPMVLWTGSSIDISFTGSPNDQFAFNSADLGTAEFSISTEATTVTPEPATLALLATGLIGIAGIARRRRKGEA